MLPHSPSAPSHGRVPVRRFLLKGRQYITASAPETSVRIPERCSRQCIPPAERIARAGGANPCVHGHTRDRTCWRRRTGFRPADARASLAEFAWAAAAIVCGRGCSETEPPWVKRHEPRPQVATPSARGSRRPLPRGGVLLGWAASVALAGASRWSSPGYTRPTYTNSATATQAAWSPVRAPSAAEIA